MYLVVLENGKTVEAESFGDMLEKAHQAGQRVLRYDVVGRKSKKAGKREI